MERLQVLDEQTLALVKGRGADLDDVRVEIKKGLVEMPTKPDGLQAVKLPRLEVAFFDQLLELLKFGDDFRLRPRLCHGDCNYQPQHAPRIFLANHSPYSWHDHIHVFRRNRANSCSLGLPRRAGVTFSWHSVVKCAQLGVESYSAAC